jgi:hypothetical protein
MESVPNVSATPHAASDQQAILPEPGYWSVGQLAAYLGVSRWTIRRRVSADPAFPMLTAFGDVRFPVERVKAYLQRQEQGRGRGYKTRGFLHLAAQPAATVDGADRRVAP